ncbi:MAG: hypothetical protein ACE5GQ_02130 [Nitrospinales bacterium]
MNATVKKWSLNIVLMLTVCFFAMESGASNNRASQGISISEGKFWVNVKDHSLCALLQEIAKPWGGGKGLSCPSGLKDARVSLYFHAPSRSAAMLRLLREYSIIGLWDKGGGLSAIYFLGSKVRSVSSPRPEKTARAKPRPNLLGMNLTVEQLRKLARQTFKKPLPDEMFNLREYKPLFNMAEVRSPKDWLTITKALQVKRHIRKLLKLKKNAKSS